MMQESERLPILVFSERGTFYIISLEDVRYIDAYPKSVTGLPNSPMYVNGICNMSGESITLVDIGMLLFGQEQALNSVSKDYVVVVENTGFIVDEVLGIEQTENFTLSNTKLTGKGLIKNSYTFSSVITELYSVIEAPLVNYSFSELLSSSLFSPSKYAQHSFSLHSPHKGDFLHTEIQ